jgi:excisionase family DNA binding protein
MVHNITDSALFGAEVNNLTQLLSIKEASELLALKPATIRAWLLRRRLPRVNCGRSVRIPAEAIARFIELNTIPAKEEQR